MIEFEEYKLKLNDLKPKLEALAASLNLDRVRNELERFHAMQEAPGFWDDPDRSQKIVVQTKLLEAKLEKYHAMTAQMEDLLTICEMALEENDDSMLPELQEGFEELSQRMEEARLETLLTGEYDSNNALMSFHAGAGGTEAQDWCQMLYRMYTRWAERHGFTYKILDYLEGDEAGLKSADIMIEGPNAYGFLKGENGVHRLVRVSPFDANARRQTSFAAVEVIPEITDTSNDVEIRPEDIEMQVYRSSGAGGQHINKTSSAVRLIHKPTGIVVSCQTERSQFQNRETCMRMLRSKLVEIKEREHLEKISDIKGVQQKIEWGSQIRNYVFMPYTLVKDTRTGCETSNVNAVMDGALDPFINAYLTCIVTGNWVTTQRIELAAGETRTQKKVDSVAIDGPAGAGKSTLARQAARDLGFQYVDTGAIYRTVGYHMTLMGIGPKDRDGIERLLDDVNLELRYDGEGLQHMILNGSDVTEEIRTPEMSRVASLISAQPAVRAFLLDLQRDMAKRYSVMMDGRDIGTVVLPGADVKVYLTASPEVRARRRLGDLEAQGLTVSYEQVLEEIRQRDHQDMTRSIAPLKQAKDAVVLDTSSLNQEESLAALKAIVEERIAR